MTLSQAGAISGLTHLLESMLRKSPLCNGPDSYGASLDRAGTAAAGPVAEQDRAGSATTSGRRADSRKGGHRMRLRLEQMKDPVDRAGRCEVGSGLRLAAGHAGPGTHTTSPSKAATALSRAASEKLETLPEQAFIHRAGRALLSGP